MPEAAFDKKFGGTFLKSVPASPGVYRYLNEAQEVIYVGKAKNLRRRLSSYRNASRKRAHRKMRVLVREAHHLTFEIVETEEAALLRERELILKLRPVYNVEGAYSFLYPSVGVGQWDKHLLLCFTTQPEEFRHLGLSFYGCFRSRPRVKAAFDGLVEILSLIGHREKGQRLPPHPSLKGSRLVGMRQIPPDVSDSLPWFFAGDEASLPGEIARLLLAKPRARRDAPKVEEHLKQLRDFYEKDAVRLRKALQAVGRPGSYVSQEERDTLFIRSDFSEHPQQASAP